ncbi:MAG: transposase [Candidatus Hydrogenedentes bacterium]|nr:transposase [Candidatus Hydrogenedentota bacterium]
MVRRARTVIPGFVHHAMQLGCDHHAVFSTDQDYGLYLDFLHTAADKHGLSIWAYCLMPDHVRLIAVPGSEESLGGAIRDAHSAFAMRHNRNQGDAGPVWQDRFSSCVLDDLLVWSAVRLVESIPVLSGIADKAEDYPWSSAAAHCGLRRDEVLADSFPPPGAIDDWSEWLTGATKEAALDTRILLHTRTGHPCGTAPFIEDLEQQTGRILRPQRRGPKPRSQGRKR